jgi:hypothetical protein
MSAVHMDLVELRDREEHLDAEECTEAPPPSYLALADSGTRALLQSIAAGVITGNRGDQVSEPAPPSPDLAPIPKWGLFEVHGDTDLALSAEEQGIALIAQSLLDRFDEMSVGSEDDEVERSDDGAENEAPEPTVPGPINYYTVPSFQC